MEKLNKESKLKMAIIPVKWIMDITEVQQEILSRNVINRRRKRKPNVARGTKHESFILVYRPIMALMGHTGGDGSTSTRQLDLETVLEGGLP